MEIWGLFLSAFLSSTLLPGGSEILLAALYGAGDANPWSLLVSASLGNTLGGMVSFGMGVWLGRRRLHEQQLKPPTRRALLRVRRWGAPSLLLSWLPVVGDPMCLAAGWLGLHWLPALAWITLGKTARYGLLLWWMDLPG